MIYTIAERVDMVRDALEPTLWPGGLMLTGNARAHLWRVAVYADGAPVDLTGLDAVAKFRRSADDVTVVQTATVAGNEISVELAQDCYRYAGRLTAMLELTGGSGEDAVVLTAKVTYFDILAGSGDRLSDPENLIPSIGEILAQMDEMVAATQDAQDATEDAETGATNAEEAAEAAEAVTAKLTGLTASAVEVESTGTPTATVGLLDGHYHIVIGAKNGQDGADAVIGDLAAGQFALYVDDNGDLICEYNGAAPPPMAIDANGDLIWTYEEA